MFCVLTYNTLFGLIKSLVLYYLVERMMWMVDLNSLRLEQFKWDESIRGYFLKTMMIMGYIQNHLLLAASLILIKYRNKICRYYHAALNEINELIVIQMTNKKNSM
jgi:hypothetical protein